MGPPALGCGVETSQLLQGEVWVCWGPSRSRGLVFPALPVPEAAVLCSRAPPKNIPSPSAEPRALGDTQDSCETMGLLGVRMV